MAKATGPSKAVLADLMRAAHAAGMAAGAAAVPPVMIVRRHENPLDDSSPVANEWIVPDGPCGFAWVTIRPANSRAARVMAEELGARTNSYEGGMMLWVSAFNQSMARKEAYAAAFAEVLRAEGIRAYAGSRMD
jgi:hypothetical protein